MRRKSTKVAFKYCSDDVRMRLTVGLPTQPQPAGRMARGALRNRPVQAMQDGPRRARVTFPVRGANDVLGTRHVQVLPTAPGFYSIGQLCRLLNTTPRALRYYEAKGLLAPDRDGPYRVYARREFQRLCVILDARKLGLSIEDIRQILLLYRRSDRGAAQIRKAVECLSRRAAELEAETALTNQRLSALEDRLRSSARSDRGAISELPRCQNPELRHQAGHLLAID
jgi:DNA-binding transcriptional MerR regulator